MRTLDTVAGVREAVAAARAAGCKIGLVPTMGYLHEGHLSLVRRARDLSEFVVVSIFVNPLQFGPGEDFERYPREPERDSALLETCGTDVLFMPGRDEMYPAGEPRVRVAPGPLADRLCGAFRPGHFEGVLTVVAKLFNVVGPDVAVFGRKDFQQAVLVRRMTLDLGFGVHVDVAPIVREPDGLALSSRNSYLDAAERARAVALHRGLEGARAAYVAGERDGGRLRTRVADALREQRLEPQYVELVEPDGLEAVATARPGCVLAVAAYVGATRLIDNIVLE